MVGTIGASLIGSAPRLDHVTVNCNLQTKRANCKLRMTSFSRHGLATGAKTAVNRSLGPTFFIACACIMWRAASARCLFVAARSYRPSVSPAPRSFWGVSRGLSSHASRPLLMSPVSVSTTTTLTTMTTSNDAPCDAPVSEDDQVVINPDGTISHVHHVHGGDHAHHHHGASSTTTTLTTVVEAQTFYRRPLPPMLTSFQSTEGKKLFRRALEANYLEAYFALASNFVTQAEPACAQGMIKKQMCWLTYLRRLRSVVPVDGAQHA